MARPFFTPTREQQMTVGIMASAKFTHAQICERIINPSTGKQIDEKTLRRYFRAELDQGTELANALVTQALFKKATGNEPGSVTAAIFWLKCKAGWKETQVVEHALAAKAPTLSDFYASTVDVTPEADT